MLKAEWADIKNIADVMLAQSPQGCSSLLCGRHSLGTHRHCRAGVLGQALRHFALAVRAPCIETLSEWFESSSV